MNKDMEQMEQMKTHDVYEEVSTDTVDQETLHNAIDSRWAHKNKTPTEVRSRIVAKGYKEEVEDLDGIYASAPFFDMTGGEKVATEALSTHVRYYVPLTVEKYTYMADRTTAPLVTTVAPFKDGARVWVSFVQHSARKAPPTKCVIGSCNLTTSSKANRGAYLELARSITFEKEWVRAFEAA